MAFTYRSLCKKLLAALEDRVVVREGDGVFLYSSTEEGNLCATVRNLLGASEVSSFSDEELLTTYHAAVFAHQAEADGGQQSDIVYGLRAVVALVGGD
jgi:hypothetical protein